MAVLSRSLCLLGLLAVGISGQECNLSRDTSVPDVTGYEQQESEESVNAVLDSLRSSPDLNFNAQYSNGERGEVFLDIMSTIDNIQSSNYNPNSFKIRNIGRKNIAAFFLDTSGAILGDSVFDPVGLAGDSVNKALEIDNMSGIKVLDLIDNKVVGPNDITDPFVFPSQPPIPGSLPRGEPGFRGLFIKFGENSFTPDKNGGNFLGFSIDMDPNSLAGTEKSDVTGRNTRPEWDGGGVSGAELIGSKFHVIFDDGSRAVGYLGSSGTQAGSIGVAKEGNTFPSSSSVTISVKTGDGTFVSGERIGTYGGEEPAVTISGQPNARVVVNVIKGLQPVRNSDIRDTIEERLQATQKHFPVNNYFEVQTETVTLDGNGIACIDTFDWSTITSTSRDTDPYIAIAASRVLGSSAPSNYDKAPMGPVAKVFLQNNGNAVSNSCPMMTCGDPVPDPETSSPTNSPSASPTSLPTSSPTETKSSSAPTASPTSTLTNTPTLTPTSGPTSTPSLTPTLTPSLTPTSTPSLTPTSTPSLTPSFTPTLTPTLNPTHTPTTISPTTEAPTTEAPTTEAPTTEAPTTIAPTTIAPTTVAPTTVSLTTSPTNSPTQISVESPAPGDGNTISSTPESPLAPVPNPGPDPTMEPLVLKLEFPEMDSSNLEDPEYSQQFISTIRNYIASRQGLSLDAIEVLVDSEGLTQAQEQTPDTSMVSATVTIGTTQLSEKQRSDLVEYLKGSEFSSAFPQYGQARVTVISQPSDLNDDGSNDDESDVDNNKSSTHITSKDEETSDWLIPTVVVVGVAFVALLGGLMCWARQYRASKYNSTKNMSSSIV